MLGLDHDPALAQHAGAPALPTPRGMTTMKPLLCAVLLIALPVAGQAQAVQDDPVALQLIDHMSDVIGELNSCSYRLRVERDVNDPSGATFHEVVDLDGVGLYGHALIHCADLKREIDCQFIADVQNKA